MKERVIMFLSDILARGLDFLRVLIYKLHVVVVLLY